MRLVTFVLESQEGIGAAIEGAAGRVVDLHRAYACYLREVERAPSADPLAAAMFGRDMVDLFKRGEKALAAARTALAHAENNLSVDSVY